MQDHSSPERIQLVAENAELRARLADAEELLGAIRRGEVDALVVEGAEGPRVFTLQGIDAESNRFRGEILTQVRDAVIAIDPDGRIIYLNPAAELQYHITASGALGRQLGEIYQERWLHADDAAAKQAALAERGEWRGENLQVLNDGSVLPVESHFTVFRDGAISGLLAVIRDVSERKRAEDAVVQVLRDADRRKDEFLAILAHELRNPLAPIRNAVQFLHMKGPVTLEGQWAQSVIDRQVGYMTRLIDDLMDVSRINRGKIYLRREPVELSRVLNEAIETTAPFIEEMGHELRVELPPEPMAMQVDPTRLAQVFANLLNNAAKYTERGGRIEVSAQVLGNRAVVSVRDTGIGIAPDKLATLFQMFSQVDDTLTRAQGGLGIGLYLVKRLVEMHDGDVEVQSEGLNTGTTFVVRLPLLGRESTRERSRSLSDEASSANV